MEIIRLLVAAIPGKACFLVMFKVAWYPGEVKGPAEEGRAWAGPGVAPSGRVPGKPGQTWDRHPPHKQKVTRGALNTAFGNGGRGWRLGNLPGSPPFQMASDSL